MTNLRTALAVRPVVGQFTPEQYLLADLLGVAVTGTPIGGHVMRWLGDVRIGDVVIEVTSPHRNPWEHCIGILVREYDEPYLDEDGKTWLRDDGSVASEHTWVLATNAGEITWRNAAFRRVPVTPHQASLLRGWGTRCVMADCKDCARETWKKIGESPTGWRQEMRK